MSIRTLAQARRARTPASTRLESPSTPDDADWLDLRLELWPDRPRDQHLREMASLLATPGRHAPFVARAPDGRAVGLAEASIRSEPVDGPRSTPVGRLEGLFVRAEARGRGLARLLVDAVSRWAAAQGCAELASDTRPGDLVGQTVHARLGFAETARAVSYAKALGAGPEQGQGAVASPHPRTAPITDADPAVEAMEARVARFHRLEPTADYLDSAIPGCERTTYRVIGERPAAPLQATDFHMNIVRCDPGKSAPLHNHLTEEVFVALTGRWEVFWGPQGERRLVLEPLDTVSIPPGVSRGFRNVATEPALLLGMAGGREPGQINWPAQVRAAASAAGVALPGS